MADASYQPKVYVKQDGEEMVVASGGSLDIESGGAFKIAGTQVTASAAQLNAVNSYMVVQVHKSSIGNSQNDIEIFEFTTPAALTLTGVQVYCTATNATASVDVKEGGTTVLESAVTPQANTVVSGTVSDSAIASGAAVTVHATTDGTGDITDLTVTLIFKAAHVA